MKQLVATSVVLILAACAQQTVPYDPSSMYLDSSLTSYGSSSSSANQLPNTPSSSNFGPNGHNVDKTAMPSVGADGKKLSDSEMLKLQMARAERAIIRLDKRVQMLEANSLTSLDDNSFGTKPANNKKPMSQKPRLQPMSANVTEPAATSSISNIEGSSWSINYSGSKIWPEKEHLTTSRPLISAVKSGHTSITAKSNNVNSTQVKERVEAISKYVSKMTNTNVNINLEQAANIPNNTIEYIAN